VAPDGTIRWHQWTDRAIFDERGQVVYEVGFDPQDETIWAKIMVSNKRWRCRH